MVCFCDIPDSDLAIHVNKYSRFGLAFKKEFLIAKGACPVFYVANESPVSATEIFSPDNFATALIEAARARGWVDRALYFSTSVRALLDLCRHLTQCAATKITIFQGRDESMSSSECKTRFGQLLGLTDDQISAAESALRSSPRAAKNIEIFRNFLIAEVFSFIKCFDAKGRLFLA